MKHLSFILPLLALSGCTQSFLSVHTDYLSHENLASYHVQTPDPLLNDPPIGQRLLVNWSFPKDFLAYEDLHLEITIRFRNREQLTERVSLCKRSGTFVYRLLNDDYIAKRGILTYKVDLVGNGAVLEAWRHQIWTDLIFIGEKCQPPAQDDSAVPSESVCSDFEDFN